MCSAAQGFVTHTRARARADCQRAHASTPVTGLLPMRSIVKCIMLNVRALESAGSIIFINLRGATANGRSVGGVGVVGGGNGREFKLAYQIASV